MNGHVIGKVDMDDPRLTPENAAYWVEEYDRADGDWYSPEEFVMSLRRLNTDETVCQFTLKAIRDAKDR